MTSKEFSIFLADKISEFIGSWAFIIIQSSILTIWIIVNVIGVCHFDPYPFILLNLFLSFEAAYATPLILMSGNRSADRDRKHLLHDLELDEEANIVIHNIDKVLKELSEDIKIDREALRELTEAKEERAKIKALLEEVKTLIEIHNNKA